jgi:adhesin transport system outer membrane protein
MASAKVMKMALFRAEIRAKPMNKKRFVKLNIEYCMVTRFFTTPPFRSYKALMACVSTCLLTAPLVFAQAQSNNTRSIGNSVKSNFNTGVPTNEAFDALLLGALNNHPTVRSARANAQGARQDVEAAEWAYWPTVSLNAAGTNTSTPDAVKNPASVLVQQPIWSGGATSARVAAAEKIDQASVEQIEVARADLAIRMVEVWANFLEADASRAVASKTLQGLTRYQAIMRRRIDGGLSSEVEQRLLSVRYLRAQSDLADANTALEIALQRLEQLAGKASVSTVELKRPLPKEPLSRWMNANQAKSMTTARLANHPAVRKAEWDASAALDQLSVQKADRWPKLVLSYQHNIGNLPANVDRDVWQLGLNYTPGAGLSSFAQSAAEEARYRALVDSVDTIRQQKQELMMLDWSNLRREIDRQEGLLATIDNAKAVLASYERQYFAGLKTWLEVLNALQELSQAELRPTQAMNAATLAYYRWRINGGDLPTNSQWTR